MTPFRVLTIDGGGIRGVFAAAFLATLEEGSGARTADRFDLVVGTSTGGILALGLGLGFSAQEMLDFYRTYGPSIFASSRTSRRWRAGLGLFRRRYGPKPLRTALEAVFGGRKLRDATTNLVIPATSAHTGDVYLFKTPHHPRFIHDKEVSAVDVALATAAAPLYLSAHRTGNGMTLLDGGLWANNPTMVGVVEALAVFKQPPEAVRVLSLGCGTTPRALSEFARRNGGVLAWRSGVEWLLHGQSVTAINQAGLMLGKEAVLRIAAEVEPGLFAMDDTSSVDELVALGRERARKASPDALRAFPPSGMPSEVPPS